MEEKKKKRKLYGRKFRENDKYKDDDVYWKLYDIVVLRDQKACFKPIEKQRSKRCKNYDNEQECTN